MIERTVKAGAEAVGGVSNIWRTTYAKASQSQQAGKDTPIDAAATTPTTTPSTTPLSPKEQVAATEQAIATDDVSPVASAELMPQGRLYLRLRLAKLKDLQTELPHVVPPAAIPLEEIRRAPKKTSAEWATGLKSPNRMFRIISLDGGGVRGVLTAGVLRRLVKSNRFPQLLQDADLIAGTSTGGILALLFAAGKKGRERERWRE